MNSKVWKLLGSVFIVIFALSAALCVVHSAGVVNTISVGSYPMGVAYDSGKGEIFVANAASSTVSVISDSNNTVTATVPVGSYPMGVAYDSGKGEIFVANAASNTVSVISGAPNLAAPTATPTPGRVDQGQTSVLSSSAVTTGTSPYTYQWFSEAPGASSYSPISGANSSSYSFATSTSTATGTWSFELQVTDVTGAMVTSPAATVTVNSLVHFSATDWAIVIVVIVIVVILLILYAVLRRRKKRIVAKADPNGTISPAKTVNVDRGADQALTIAANPHYQISDVQVDCESIGPK